MVVGVFQVRAIRVWPLPWWVRVRDMLMGRKEGWLRVECARVRSAGGREESEGCGGGVVSFVEVDGRWGCGCDDGVVG